MAEEMRQDVDCSGFIGQMADMVQMTQMTMHTGLVSLTRKWITHNASQSGVTTRVKVKCESHACLRVKLGQA